MEIKSVGVVGAGQMGSGIAHVFALAGYDVRLTDVSREALERARTGMERALARQVERDRLTEADRAAALARLTLEEDLAALGPADLVIEAATEREAVKHAIFAGLAPTLAPHTILTSNTSSISITRLAAATDRPERFMGLHFMNPVPVMQLVELIRGIQTDEATYRTLVGVVERLGKTHTSAEDFPAFIVNRILMPMINEAVYTLYEGVGSVTAIDASLKLGANHPMGPLELADLIGLDTCLAIMNVLHEGLADTKYRPCPLLVKYVEAGWLGRKTRRGFYDYRGRGAGADPVTERRFTAADQEAFAALSGDRNPMHMDAAAARRTQAGTCAVHGVAATLWALEALAAEAPLAGLAALKAEFQGFIPVDAPVALGITARSPDRLRAEIRRDGARAIALDLRLAPASAAPGSNRGRLDAPADPVPPAALDRRFEELEGAAGALAASEGATAEAAARYPRLAAALGPERVAALALASTLVGMVAPGLHSIFSGLTVAFGPGDGRPPVLAWHVARADARFRLVTLEVAAPGFVGSLRAFVRFPPVAPPAFAAAAARVPPGAFAGRHALVVGGSRGLGAATALLLAAGGAAITLTYRSGRDEAEAVAAAIADAGGVARILPYDATAPAAAQLAGLAPVTDCFYFATGQIADGASAYRRARLDAFLAVYADGFAALVEALLAAAPDRPLHAFYPSSVFVEARPAGMTEYAMAKAAGEVLAAELARGRRRLTVSVPRLPRVLTDQTATVPPVPAADPLEVMAATLLGDGPTG